MSISSVTTQSSSTKSSTSTAERRRPPGLDVDVEVDAELRRARQLVRHFATLELAAPQAGDRVGQPYVSASPATPAVTPTATVKPVAATSDGWASAPLWMGGGLLTLGLAFLAWSVLQQQADWWQPGLPLTILGQASLTLGLLLRPRNLARS